jgi:hypothetical protein
MYERSAAFLVAELMQRFCDATINMCRWLSVGSGGETIAKHRQAALRFGFGRLVLQDVPVFGQAAVLDSDNIRAVLALSTIRAVHRRVAFV